MANLQAFGAHGTGFSVTGFYLSAPPGDDAASLASGSQGSWRPAHDSASQDGLAALCRAVPLRRRVVVEDQRLVGRDDEPEPTVELALELARRPARVASREDRAARPHPASDGLEDRRIAGDGHAVVDDAAVAAAPVGGVEHEAAAGLHRAAVVDADVAAHAGTVAAERLQHAHERHRAERTIHDEPQRARPVVAEHVDDGALEARIAQDVGGDEELAGRAAGGR